MTFFQSSADPVLVTGGRTSLAFANAADPTEVELNLRDMNRVIEYEPADLTIAVEAGITLGELNQVLGEHNQTLPLDAGQPENATLGGLFASGLAGPRRLKYGSLRDWVLGIEVVSANGVRTKSGGMVVKNVTGYDIPRLHYGAHGSFGVVTRLNLKVLPIEQASRSIVLPFTTIEDAYAAAFAVLRSQLEPAAVTISHETDWTLAVICDGPEDAIDWQSGSVVEVVESVVSPREIHVSEGPDVGLQRFLHAVDLTSNRSVARLSIPASQQIELASKLSLLSGSELVADVGSGLVYVSGLPSIEWREAVRRIHPASVFLALPEELKQDIDVFGPIDSQSCTILQRLKREHDPSNQLNPGRFVKCT